MKEAAILVLLAVAIVGGIGIWLANGNSMSIFSTQPSSAQTAVDAKQAEAQAQASEEAARKEAAAKPRRSAKAAKKADAVSDAEIAAAPVAPLAEVVVAPPPPAPKQFPAATEISVGAQRENIAEKFGQPSLATTTTSGDGRVLETLVYARKSGRDVTVIRIEDGRVLSAYTR